VTAETTTAAEGKKTTARKAVVSPRQLLLPYQRRWVEDDARFKIGAWGRQTGKSFSTSEEAVENSVSDPGTTWVCLSAGERQALEWLGKAKEWAAVWGLAMTEDVEERDSAEALLKSAEIRFKTGSRIIAIPANPKTARGYAANIVLDEFAYHEDPDAIWRAMYPSITNPLAGSLVARYAALKDGRSGPDLRRFKLRIVSTFNGRGNKFFELWEKAKENGYSQHLVTIEQAFNEGLPVDLAELHRGIDDEESWAQEYMCEPLDTSAVLLPYDLIQLAETPEATESNEVPDPAANREIYLGIDFGRQNDPTVCWTLEIIGGIKWTREVLVLKAMDTPDQQEVLRSRIRAARRVCFDYTGPGIGLGDYLAKEFGRYDPVKHEFGPMELCTFTSAFKRDIFPKLRREFEAPTKLRIPVSRAVREDLHAMQQTSKNGQYDYWAPRTREGHSDRCTALALAVRAAGDEGVGCGIW